MKNKSYTSIVTKKVKPYRAYEIDYKSNTGDFSKKISHSSDQKINLVYETDLGRWVGNNGWTHSRHKSAYHLTVFYNNKNNIKIVCEAYSTSDPLNQESFLFMKKIAKDFYLNNELGMKKLPLNSHLKWDSIIELINSTDEGTTTMRKALSWSKIMTLNEATLFFESLGTQIKFPS